MRRLIAAVLLIGGCVALYVLQHAKAEAPISPAPVLYLVADTEREAERIPLAITRVSDTDENKIGEQIAGEYGLTAPGRLARDKSGDTAAIEGYLNIVGNRLTQHIQRPAIHYHFYVDDDPYLVNAFSLPGGNIVVGRGLLNLLESEDELAAILGHEITHVDNRHAIERLQYELAARKYGLSAFYQLGRPAIEIFRAGYTKEQELEADRVGLGFAVRAGYSPEGGVAVMKRFEKLETEKSDPSRPSSPIEEIAQVSVESLQQYFQSHPPASERLASMESEISAQGWTISPQRPFSIRPIFLADQGESLDVSGDFATSIARFKQALTVDPNYTRAWHGLAEATWRFGDAPETAHAAAEAARRGLVARDWQLLSRALAVTELLKAQDVFSGYVNTAYGDGKGTDSYLAATVDLAGLRFLSGNQSDVNRLLRTSLSSESSTSIELRCQLLREVAWWMYRAVRPDQSARVLEDARQMLPHETETMLELTWVYSDLGRQADAGQSVSAVSGSSPRDAEYHVALAVISARTHEHSDANNQFRAAAKEDPVWMVARWVENNYSSSAAAIIKQLQTEELARRKKEAEELARLKTEAESSQHPGK